MARSVEGPWFRASKGTWYATVGPRKVSLGVKGEGRRADAVKAWHRLMADGQQPPPINTQTDRPEEGTKGPGQRSNRPNILPSVQPLLSKNSGGEVVVTVTEAAGRFLEDVAARLKPTTARIYANDVGSFTRATRRLDVRAVTAQHVARWLSGLPVKPTTKGIMLRSVSAFFGWCVQADLCPANPAKRIPKPKGVSRSASAVVSEAEHEKLLSAATPTFRLVLDVLHATGCRPGEAASLSAENTDLEAGVAVLEQHKCDRHGKPRLVFLPESACLKLRASAAERGPLLRTAKGNPWTGRSITQAMRRVCKAAGIKAIAYGYRHTFATDALARGVSDAQVAALLGHSSTAVLHKHYSHLTSRATVLRQAVAAVRD
jgi:site-specific recombinase XerD